MGKCIFTFSGQGSQYHQMGWDLYQNNRAFREITNKADTFCHQLTGISFLEALYDKSKGIAQTFDFLPATHPALFSIQYAAAKVAMEKHQPDLLIGGSLGELIALTVSGALLFEEALEFIALQPQLFESCCRSGVLIALFCEKAIMESLIEKFSFSVYLAVSGSSKNYTLALSPENLGSFENELKQRELLYQKLPTNIGFHSPLIDEAKKAYLFLADKMTLKSPKIPTASCVTTNGIDNLSAPHLWNIVRETVYLRETLALNINPNEDYLIDFSPQSSHLAIAKELFGQNSALIKNSHKTITPFQAGQKNMENLLAC